MINRPAPGEHLGNQSIHLLHQDLNFQQNSATLSEARKEEAANKSQMTIRDTSRDEEQGEPLGRFLLHGLGAKSICRLLPCSALVKNRNEIWSYLSLLLGYHFIGAGGGQGTHGGLSF